MSDRAEIIELLARYVRALEERDGKAVADLYTPDGEFRFYSRAGWGKFTERADGPVAVGREEIEAVVAVAGIRPIGRGFHYLTTDHIVDIHGDAGTISSHLILVESNTEISPATEWSLGAAILNGALAITMCGRYDSDVRKINGRWLFTVNRVKHNLTAKN